MKKIATSLALSLSLFAGSNLVLPYGGYIDYSGTTDRDDAAIAGVYLSSYKAPYKLEMALEHMRISYEDSTPRYKQNSLAAIVHYYKGYNWDFRAGANILFVDQGARDETQKLYMAGVTYYQAYDYNIAADIYYSDYEGFHVWQLSPKVGKTLGQYHTMQGSFYVEAGVDYIAVSDDAAKEDSYTTFNAKIQNFNGPWTTTLEGSVGKNSYRVAKGGFVVYNLGEEYKYSYGLSVARALGATSSLKLGFARAKFDEAGNDAYSNIFVIAYTRSF